MPLSVLLAVTQCPSVIASPVISSLLPVVALLAAVSAHIDELCQCKSSRASLPGTASLAGFVCRLSVVGFLPKFSSVLSREYFLHKTFP